jgi:hypothetical protein
MMMSQRDEQKRIELLSYLLDHRFQGPWGMKFGLDGVLGLIPGVGDLVTTGLSIYILTLAASLGAGPSLLVRMGLNIFIESIVDLIPIVGNVFDFYWKSNIKNVELLRRHLKSPVREAIKSRVILALISLGLILLLVFSAILTIRFIKFLF